MPSALSHDPSISTPGASTDNAIVIFDGTGGTGFGNSTILVDSGGNGRIGIAADTDIITVTAETVTIAGKLVATSIDVGDGAVTVDVTQSNHSLTVGMPIKVSGANQYAAAQADSAANAEVVGIVTAVASSSAFTMTLAGEVTTATAVPDSTSPGDIVYLSASSAGAVTTTEPSTAGQVSKPIGVITEANNKMIMLPFRGEVVSSATDSMDLNGTELVLDVDADTSITADTDDQIDIKISGADDFRFTANNFNVLSGSTLTIDSGATITNSGTATGFSSNSFTNDVTVTSGNIVIATAGQGIDFSATANSSGSMSSELLDWYEEGTFTPTIADNDLNASESQAYHTQVGRYVRIGRMVHCHITLHTSSIGNLTTSHGVKILGLPFSSVNSGATVGGGSVYIATSMSLTSGTSITVDVPANVAYCRLQNFDASTGTSTFLLSEWGGTGNILLSLTYEAA